MIEFQSVTKLYKTVLGVNDITISLGSGAFGLLGPNGSGKTTLINLLIGQLTPTLGVVRLFGQNPITNTHLLRRVGLCPTSHPEIPRLSAYDWVRFLVRQHGFTTADSNQRAKNSLELVGMTQAMHRPLQSYSLGMRQRAKLAQALAHDPELLILDEPFNGLDPVGRHEMTELLREWTKSGRSLIIASHVLHEVEAVNPSFLLLSSGRLLASGSAREVRDLLTDVPNTIQLRSTNRQKLATALIESLQIDSVQFANEEGVLLVSTRSPKALYEALPEICARNGTSILELHSTDSSLQQLFSTLMQIHRGQSRGNRKKSR